MTLNLYRDDNILVGQHVLSIPDAEQLIGVLHRGITQAAIAASNVVPAITDSSFVRPMGVLEAEGRLDDEEGLALATGSGCSLRLHRGGR